MKVLDVQNANHPKFGIKYLNKNAWSPKVLQTFEESELLKSIDKNYPNASVKYSKISGEDSISNSEIIHTLTMEINLAKNKIFCWNLSSHSEKVPEKHLIDDINNMTLKDIEQGAQATLKPVQAIMMNKIKNKQNPITSFFKRIFS